MRKYKDNQQETIRAHKDPQRLYVKLCELNDTNLMKKQQTKRNSLSKEKLDQHCWIVGFIEGCGSFCIYKSFSTIQFEFVIYQQNPLILNKLKKILGFGIVEQYQYLYRYIVKTPKDIYKLILFLNEKIYLNRTYFMLFPYLQLWHLLEEQNKPKAGKKNQDQLSHLKLMGKKKILQSLENHGWFSGYIDAKGIFFSNKFLTRTASKKDERTLQYQKSFFIFSPKIEKVKLQFSFEDEPNLSFFRNLKNNFLLGNVYSGKRHSDGKVQKYKYTYEAILDDKLDPITKYLKKFPLKSQKNIQFLRWRKIIYRLIDGNKRDTNPKAIKRFHRLIKNLNRG